MSVSHSCFPFSFFTILCYQNHIFLPFRPIVISSASSILSDMIPKAERKEKKEKKINSQMHMHLLRRYPSIPICIQHLINLLPIYFQSLSFQHIPPRTPNLPGFHPAR